MYYAKKKVEVSAMNKPVVSLQNNLPSHDNFYEEYIDISSGNFKISEFLPEGYVVEINQTRLETFKKLRTAVTFLRWLIVKSTQQVYVALEDFIESHKGICYNIEEILTEKD